MRGRRQHEKKIEREIRKYLQLLGYLVIKTDAGIVARYSKGQIKRTDIIAGFPDLIVLKPGIVFFLEVKSVTGRLSKQQKLCHEYLKGLGFDVYVVRDIESVVKICQRYQTPKGVYF